jgi:polar amino acid transport system substrate-binding protein
VDFTVTNATTARSQIVDFSKTLLSLELGILVPAHSLIDSIPDIDKAGVKIGVAKGSTSERTLPMFLKNASVVSSPSLKDAARMIQNKELDGFATNKAILFEMSDRLPGARILNGRWGIEHLAIAVPKGRESAHDYISQFVVDVQSSGLLRQVVERAGLRGLPKPE